MLGARADLVVSRRTTARSPEDRVVLCLKADVAHSAGPYRVRMRVRWFSADGAVPLLDRWGDVALCAALTLVNQVVVWGDQTFAGPRVVNAALGLMMTTALLWRRRRPVPVLAAVVTIVAGHALAFGATESAAVLLPFLVAVYSAAVYGDPAYVIAPLALLGIVVHGLRDPLITTPSQAWFSPLVTGAVFIIGRIVYARRKQAADAESRAEQAEQDREQAIVVAVAAEQRRIGRELHDVVAHSISVMALQAGAADRVLARSPDLARDALRVIRETGHEAVREMGRLLSLEHDPTPGPHEPLPSVHALPALLERVRVAGLDAELAVDGEVRDLPPGVDLALFRIAQEGLTNALKHAPKARTCVSVCYDRDSVGIEVLTVGPTSPSAAGTGRGLVGIADRVDVVGGRFEAGPHDGRGWRLAAVLPTPS